MIIFKLLEEEKTDRSYGSYITYGIAVYRNSAVIREIGDISLEKNKVSSLIDVFNQEQLSPAHLDEALENFLYDFEV